MPNKRGNRSKSEKKTKVKGDAKKTTTTGNQNKKKNEKKSTTAARVEPKMTLSTLPTASVRPQVRERRPGRPPSSGKRMGLMRDMPAKVRSAFRRSLDPCDNSNDSGLGFDHHHDQHNHNIHPMADRLGAAGWTTEAKRPKMDIKLEHEDVNEHYGFPDTMRACKENTSLIRTAPAGSIPSLSMNNNQTSSSGRAVPRCVPLSNRGQNSEPVPLMSQLTNTSKYASDVSLTIVKQPEQQHRARYQTEGSRGAVKDRDGNGFPIVQLVGYYKPTTLQVFIGTDVDKVAPHMFYQACKVSGKNSTPCAEKKLEGTCVIELQLDPGKEMSATCDCVGILKERNVDVEHRFPEQLGNRSKKKSTRCRMVFRTTLTHENGATETLQVCSQPIVCTQPPGIPEICKKSLTACPANGGLELFVLGKNFLKDTKVYFQQFDEDRHVRWEQAVAPDKEFLQQTHFVCVVPPYRRTDIIEPVQIRLCVVSSGKTSEPHQFVYTPVNGAVPSVVHNIDHQQMLHSPTLVPQQQQFFNKMLWPSKRDQDLGMMPPPDSCMVPLAPRRSSISVPSSSDTFSPPLRSLKQEYIDENSQSSSCSPERYRHISESSLDVHHGDSNLSLMNDNSMDYHCLSNDNSLQSMDCNLNAAPLDDSSDLKVVDLRMKMPIGTVADLVSSNAPSMATLQSFGVTEPFLGPLPAQSGQSVENFLTHIESKSIPSMLVNTLAQSAASTITEPVFLTSQRAFLATVENNCHLVAKSESAAIAEATPIVTTPTTTEKLDQLVNSTVESHIGSPTRSKSVEDNQPDVIRDVMLNSRASLLDSRASLLVPPMLNVSISAPIMATELSAPNLLPEVILNAQISPSLMCRASGDGLAGEAALGAVAVAEPEKAVLMKAAVDLFETQKKLNELDVLAATGKEIGGGVGTVVVQDKKNEDRMIPQAFTSLTENELINLINPSCFDQGNNSSYQ